MSADEILKSDNVVDFRRIQHMRNFSDDDLKNFMWFLDYEIHMGMNAREVYECELYKLVSEEIKHRAHIGNEQCRKVMAGDYS